MTVEWREDTFEIKSVTETDEGYLLLTGTVARTGILNYVRSDGSTRRELVTEEELTKADSISSLALKPVTKGHPKGMVNKDNIQELAVGKSLQKVRYLNGFVMADIIIDNSVGIEAIREDGHTELSPGYFVEVINEPGVHPEFGAYDAIQVNRKHNHIALTPKGRSGPEVSLHLDSMDIAGAVMVPSKQTTKIEIGATLMPQVNLNGLSLDVADVQTAGVINQFRIDSETAIKALGATAADETARADALVAELATANASLEAEQGKVLALEVQVKKDAGNKSNLTAPPFKKEGEDEDDDEEGKKSDKKKEDEDEDEDEAKEKKDSAAHLAYHNERTKLEAVASTFNIDSIETKSNADVKRAIVADHLGERFDEAMTTGQINGAFVMIEAGVKTRKDSYTRASGAAGGTGKPTKRTDEASAQAAYVDNLTNAWRVDATK